MDLIPLILNAFIYIFGALIVVLMISYSISKFSKNKENDEELIERRKHIRRYIINQNNYVTSGTNGNDKRLNKHYYSPPSYSNSITKNSYTRPTKTSVRNKKSTFSRSTKSGQGIRYSIVNETMERKNATKVMAFKSNSYSALKEEQYYYHR